ncbi:hypothetical protein [Aggregatilinea lenta]|nr:hypothetical protein [Aggregatilinea lenta]
MKTEVGLWIDRRQAVIVTLADRVEEIKQITDGQVAAKVRTFFQG